MSDNPFDSIFAAPEAAPQMNPFDSIFGQQEPQRERGDFSAGLAAGFEEVKGLGKSTIAIGKEALGNTEGATASFRSANENFMEAERLSEGRMASAFDIRTEEGMLPFAKDALDFVQFQVGKQLPNIATIAATAFTGGAAAPMLAGKEGAKRAATQLAKKEILKRRGQVIAGAIGAAALETGGIAAEQEFEANTRDPMVALTGGTVAGALEFLPIYNLTRMLGVGPAFRNKFLNKIAQQKLGLKALGFAGVQAGTEAVTESLQEIVAITAREIVDENYESLGPEAAKRILESAIVGGTVGGVFGGVGSVFVRPGQNKGAENPFEDILRETTGKATNPASAPPTTENPTNLPPFDETIAAVQPDPYIGELIERFGMPPPTNRPLSGPIDPVPLTQKTRLPTITVIRENGLESADEAAFAERNARNQELTYEFAKQTPPEARTPAQRALIRMIDREKKAPQLILPEERPTPEIIIPNGVYSTRNPVTLEVPDANRLQEIEDNEETRTQAQEDPLRMARLTPREREQLSKLEEWEALRGLSPGEYATYEALLAKAEGEQAAERFNPTDEEIEQFERELDAQLLDLDLDEYERKVLARNRNNGPNIFRQTREAAPVSFDTTVDDVVETIEEVAIPYGPDVVVVPTADQLPSGPIREEGQKSGTRALFVPDTGLVYIIANRNPSRDSVASAYLHETLGHYGLRAVFGPNSKAYNDFVDLMIRSFKQDLPRYEKLYNLDRNNPEHRAELAEEMFAAKAEVNLPASVLDRVVAIFRSWLRAVLPETKLTDREIRVMLSDIRKYLSAPVIPNSWAQAPRSLQQVMAHREDVDSRITTRGLELLPKKQEWITAEHVQQALKGAKARNAEINVFHAALAEMAERKFQKADFVAAVKSRIAKFEARQVRTEFADYGLSYIQRSPETNDSLGLDGIEEVKPLEIVWESELPTPISLIPDRYTHYDSTQYLAHVRGFKKRRGNTTRTDIYITEIQSDLYANTGLITEQMRSEGGEGAIYEGPASRVRKEPRRGFFATAWENEESTIYRRVVREMLFRYSILNSHIMFPTGETAARVNRQFDINSPEYIRASTTGEALGSDIPVKINPRWEGIYRRYEKDLPKVYKEFGGKLVKDQFGFTWWKVPTKTDPVKVFASRVEENANTLQKRGVEISEETVDSLSKWRNVLGARMAGMFLTPLQIARVYAIEPIQRYMDHVQKWWTTKMEVIQEFDEVVTSWNSNRDMADAVGRALFEVSTESDAKERRLDPQTEVLPILRKHKLDSFKVTFRGKEITGGEFFWEVDRSFQNLLNRLERGLKYNAALESLEDPQAAVEFIEQWESTDPEGRKQQLKAAMEEPGNKRFRMIPRINTIEKEIKALRNRNYFPRKRFGKYSVAIVAREDIEFEGKEFKAGDLLSYETFEDRKSQLERSQELAAGAKDKAVEIKLEKLTDQEFAFIGLPPTLLDTLKDELELDAAQKEKLKEISARVSPGRAFLKHLIRRKGVAGFSEDAIRVYASYGMTAASHIARVEHYLNMGSAIADLKKSRLAVQDKVRDNATVGQLYQYFNDHYRYILNPENDFAKLRALGFLWYLGFNVKSAIVNTTQVPMVLYPYLADRYGDVASVREITKGLKDAVGIYTGRSKISKSLNQMIQRGKEEGFIDESLASELAGFTESSVLERMLPSTSGGRLFSNVSYYGAFMFRHAEKFTRTASFIAAARLAERSGITDPEEIYQAGKEAVQTAMFEYSKWNRPEFMRGKKSVFFLFWQWMQHAAFLAGGGAGRGTAIRFWVMLLMAGGLQGLPFAENILDLLDFGGTKIKTALGLPEPKVDIRRSLREIAVEDLSEFVPILEDRPDLLMHGLSKYYGLGPLHSLNALGVPVPNVDISGSVSMGRFLPGIEDMLSNERSPDAKFGRAVVDALGPVAGIPYNLWKAVESTDPDVWKKWERTMPVALKSLSKAARIRSEGAETYRGGGEVLEFDPHDKEHQAELLFQAFGFAPTRLNQKFELQGVQEDMRRYYTIRRALLLEDYAYALDQGQREGLADARKAIAQYNRSLPSTARGLAISPKVLRESVGTRRTRSLKKSLGIPNERALIPAYREVERSFPEALDR